MEDNLINSQTGEIFEDFRKRLLSEDEFIGNINITLKNGETFSGPKKYLSISSFFFTLVEDGFSCPDDVDVVLSTIENATTLNNVLKFCEHFVECGDFKEIEKPLKSNLKEAIPVWYYEFVKDMNNKEIFDFILAANFLDIKSLLEFGCAVIASKLKGKTPDEIRAEFGIENELTEEEENVIKDENKWMKEE